MSGKVVVDLAISLDGFIAGAHDSPEQPLGRDGMRLFDWYFDGDTEVEPYKSAAARGVPVPPFKLSSSSAAVFQQLIDETGAAITGRRTYDIAGAWGGHGPLPGAPLFVMTHQVPESVPKGESTYTFVTDGDIAGTVARAKAAAEGKDVSLMGSAVPQQCARLGLLDEISLHVVPVLLGDGVRLLDHLGDRSIQLEIVSVVDSPGVTHLRYRVLR